MWIVHVVPIKRGLPKESLTYFSAEQIPFGTLVSVPLRSRAIDAIVTNCVDAREEKSALKSSDFALKKVIKIKDSNPIPTSIFKVAELAGKYYRRPRGDILGLLIPDYTIYGQLPEKILNSSAEKTAPLDTIPERLLFQAPLEERVTFYRTYVREAFAKKESVHFIVPTIADCDYLAESLSKGISDFVVMINSELSRKQLTTVLSRLRTETHSLVLITTPSYAIFSPKNNKTIILEHESSNAYNIPTIPAVDFRILVELLARATSTKLIVGDSLLRVETLGRQEEKEFGTVAPITFRALAPIQLSIIPYGLPENIAPRSRSEQIPALSPEVKNLLGTVAEKRLHIFAFALRTGLATVTRCRDCGTLLTCEHCSTPLVLYRSEEHTVFICNKCKRHKPSECKCDKCGSWSLSALGTGSAFVEEEIKRNFPNIPVFRIDRETTPTKNEARKVYELFKNAQSGILVGTEMALFYMIEQVDGSVVISFDTLFNIPSYRTNERIIELFLAITERTKGKLFVQTKNPDEQIIGLIKQNNYSSWYHDELSERNELHYPPYATILKITWRGKEAEKTAVRDYLEELFRPFSPDIFDAQPSVRGRREVGLNAIIRPKREDWSVFSLMHGKELSPLIREAIAKLPEGCVFAVNPDDLL